MWTPRGALSSSPRSGSSLSPARCSSSAAAAAAEPSSRGREDHPGTDSNALLPVHTSLPRPDAPTDKWGRRALLKGPAPSARRSPSEPHSATSQLGRRRDCGGGRRAAAGRRRGESSRPRGAGRGFGALARGPPLSPWRSCSGARRWRAPAPCGGSSQKLRREIWPRDCLPRTCIFQDRRVLVPPSLVIRPRAPAGPRRRSWSCDRTLRLGRVDAAAGSLKPAGFAGWNRSPREENYRQETWRCFSRLIPI